MYNLYEMVPVIPCDARVVYYKDSYLKNINSNHLVFHDYGKGDKKNSEVDKDYSKILVVLVRDEASDAEMVEV